MAASFWTRAVTMAPSLRRCCATSRYTVLRVPPLGMRGAQHRLKDGGVLLDQGRYNGAIYLAGYAIECQLKYVYCKRMEETYVPVPLETHDWDLLVEKDAAIFEA